MAVSSGSLAGLQGLCQLAGSSFSSWDGAWGSLGSTGHVLPPLDGVKPAGPPACASLGVGVPGCLLAEVRTEFQAPG